MIEPVFNGVEQTGAEGSPVVAADTASEHAPEEAPDPEPPSRPSQHPGGPATCSNKLFSPNIDLRIDAQVSATQSVLPDESALTHWVESAIHDWCQCHSQQALFQHDDLLEVAVSIVAAAEMQTINNQHRQQPRVTNVLSFPAIPPEQILELAAAASVDVAADADVANPGLPSVERELSADHLSSPLDGIAPVVDGFGMPRIPGWLPLGDIVLCADQVVLEARAQHKPVLDHYAHLVVHSTLHLLGMDHHTDTEADCMESSETRILQRLGLPDPYRAVSAEYPDVADVSGSGESRDE